MILRTECFVVVVVLRMVVLRRSRICAVTLRRTSDRLPLQAFFRAAGIFAVGQMRRWSKKRILRSQLLPSL